MKELRAEMQGVQSENFRLQNEINEFRKNGNNTLMVQALEEENKRLKRNMSLKRLSTGAFVCNKDIYIAIS